MLRETGNVGWTSECCHSITESFCSDNVIFTMPSLLASMSWKCASFHQLIPSFTRSLSKDITLCEGERDYGAGLWTDIVIEQVLIRYLKSRVGLTMTESVRQQWVYSMHACAAIHDAMTLLTGKHHTTSHQHC